MTYDELNHADETTSFVAWCDEISVGFFTFKLKEEFRFDLALSFPQDFKLNDLVTERTLPAGMYAVTMHKGSRDNIGDTIYSIYRDWLPKVGEGLGDLLFYIAVFMWGNLSSHSCKRLKTDAKKHKQ